MKRFHFPLEQVLKWRAEVARGEEARLEELLRKRREFQDFAARLIVDKQAEDRKIRAQRFLTATDLESLESFANHVRAETVRLEKEVSQVDELIVSQRVKLVEARRQQRLLERLKERKWDEWRAAADREMEAEASELYIIKLSRRGRGGPFSP